jgi:predicted nucleic acid-binding protein
LDAAANQLATLVADAEDLIAPTLLQVEFGSTLRRLERLGKFTRTEADEVWRAFRDLPIVYRWDDAWVERAFEIARSIGASRIYDSLYLACAESASGALYTCDASFVRAFGVTSHHVHLVQ